MTIHYGRAPDGLSHIVRDRRDGTAWCGTIVPRPLPDNTGASRLFATCQTCKLMERTQTPRRTS